MYCMGGVQCNAMQCSRRARTETAELLSQNRPDKGMEGMQEMQEMQCNQVRQTDAETRERKPSVAERIESNRSATRRSASH